MDKIIEELLKQINTALEGAIRSSLIQKYKIDTTDMTQKELIETIKEVLMVDKKFEADLDVNKIIDKFDKEKHEKFSESVKEYLSAVPMEHLKETTNPFEEATWDFSDVLIELELGTCWARKHWKSAEFIQVHTMVSDETGLTSQMLMKFENGMFKKYIPSDNDLFAEDWVYVDVEYDYTGDIDEE